MQLISAYVFAPSTVHPLYFINLYTKFQASSHLLLQYSLIGVRPGRKPRRQVFTRHGSYSKTGVYSSILFFLFLLQYIYMSHVMRKPTFCICENKDPDQLRGNREADQRLCFYYIDSTILLLSKSEISGL